MEGISAELQARVTALRPRGIDLQVEQKPLTDGSDNLFYLVSIVRKGVLLDRRSSLSLPHAMRCAILAFG